MFSIVITIISQIMYWFGWFLRLRLHSFVDTTLLIVASRKKQNWIEFCFIQEKRNSNILAFTDGGAASDEISLKPITQKGMARKMIISQLCAKASPWVECAAWNLSGIWAGLKFPRVIRGHFQLSINLSWAINVRSREIRARQLRRTASKNSRAKMLPRALFIQKKYTHSL